jgi:hypothetical protein
MSYELTGNSPPDVGPLAIGCAPTIRSSTVGTQATNKTEPTEGSWEGPRMFEMLTRLQILSAA